MDIRILFISGLIALIGFIILVTCRYLMGKWQWSIFFPGKIIFPKRIKTQIRKSVLMEYKAQDITGLVILEDRVEKELDLLNIHRVDVSRFAIDARIGFNKEECFKYFLFLKQVLLINQASSIQGMEAAIIEAKTDLKQLNLKFSKLYLKNGISINDRSIVLAEILYRILSQLEDKPYGYDVYTEIRHKATISKYEELIDHIIEDGGLDLIVSGFRSSNYGICHQPSSNPFGRSILFRIHILLLTKWL